MGVNYWFSHVIDTYLLTVATGGDWKAACEAAMQAPPNGEPLVVLTQPMLGPKKGITYSRQHLTKKIRNGTFPRPFKLPAADP